jgi:DNA-binding GntR family transcriptional regulator
MAVVRTRRATPANANDEDEHSVAKRRLGDDLYETLRQAIKMGDVYGGHIIESSIARYLGSSRAPVRAALQRLLKEKLISRSESRGYIVGPPDAARRQIELDRILGALKNDIGRATFLWQTLYEQVERQVVHHSFLGRSRINERELARQYRVGRTVARDILVRLEALGILEKDSSARWFVVPLDRQRISDLYEIRERLEPAALASAMLELPADTVDSMLNKLLEVEAVYPEVVPTTLFDLELDLHIRCLAAAPNKEVLKILERTHILFAFQKHAAGIQRSLPVEEHFLAEHESVFRTLRRKDPESVMLTMRAHIRSSWPRTLDRVDQVRSLPVEECSYIELLIRAESGSHCCVQ